MQGPSLFSKKIQSNLWCICLCNGLKSHDGTTSIVFNHINPLAVAVHVFSASCTVWARVVCNNSTCAVQHCLLFANDSSSTYSGNVTTCGLQFQAPAAGVTQIAAELIHGANSPFMRPAQRAPLPRIEPQHAGHSGRPHVRASGGHLCRLAHMLQHVESRARLLV